jgi:hypothetical protein
LHLLDGDSTLPMGWRVHGWGMATAAIPAGGTIALPSFVFFSKETDAFTLVALPTWLPAILFGGLSIALLPRPFRFSLRTLLIGMTVVAVVLGLMIWAAR